MKKVLFLFISLIAISFMGCDENKVEMSADIESQAQTEQIMQEANRQVGFPAIVNYQEKKNLKWIYELCDQENLICHAYLMNEMTGEVGQYLGECIGYGIPYSTQFSNPERLERDRWANGGGYGFGMPQPEPNGLFKPEGLSATWLIMIDPSTKQPRPVYVEPAIIVSPFKLN
ncbi:MAG: hypothetical protein KGZ71_09980 [Desulfobulbaceae bacterium]|nr:hypothetical protein [Candidatus Kapabacteria bacterium]MBS4000796.1 hypothetical protein [Desulfobulbaceae bacterium]